MKKKVSLHTVRMLFRTAVLTLFAVDCVRLVMLYFWNQGVIDVNFGRPQLTAGLSPLSGLCDLAVWIRTGTVDPSLPASMIIVILGIVLSLVAKRTFCSWICPIGTIFDALASVGRKIFPGIAVSQRAERNLRIPMVVLGIAVLAIVAFFIPNTILTASQQSPYWAVSDMAIILLFIKPGLPILIVAAVVLGASLLLGRNVWCQVLCPLGGIYALISKASPITVKRDEHACIGCGACTKACPAHIQVDAATASIRTVGCTDCMECIDVCPEPQALTVRAAGRKTIPAWTIPLIVLGIWMTVYAIALATNSWFGSVSAQWVMAALKTIG